MAVELGAADWIRAGSGVLYILLGIALLVTRRRGDPRVWALAIFSIGSGSTFILRNILELRVEYQALSSVLRGAAWSVAVVGMSIIALVLPAGRRSHSAVALGAAVTLAIFVTRLAREGWNVYPAGSDAISVAGRAMLTIGGRLGFAGLAGVTVVLSARAALGDGNKRQLALLTIAFSTFLAYTMGQSMLGDASTFNEPGAVAVTGAALALASILWLVATWRGGGRLARNVSLALPAAWLVGMICVVVFGLSRPDPSGVSRDWGGLGLARILGWSVLVYVILRTDVLGYDPASRSVQRGSLAAGALAALFIVAQIAQNFLAAQYGLLMGGIVAGAFLFAASPLQRAIESMRAPERATILGQGGSGDAARLATYRDAVSYALRDGVVTRKEEAHLADLAQHLAIGAGDAMRVRHEVEDERSRR